ncbi:hypothetical protein AgCh_008864 [Apium graveolens]
MGESSQVKKGKKANVGHMTVKQLSDRLEKIENMNAQFANLPFAPNPYYAAYSPTQMTKDESEIPKSNEIRPKKQKRKANKAGPKETWAPKST